MKLTVVILLGSVLGLTSVLSNGRPAVAQELEVTAGEVVDRETLKAFVEGAKEYLEGITDLSGVANRTEEFRSEGDWKSGSIYLIVLTTEGVVQFHGADLTWEGKNVIDLEDDNGVKIVQEILAAAEGGDFVEYYWDDPAVEGDEDADSPKVTYAVPVTVLGLEFVVVAGFYMDLSSVDESTIFEVLEIMAGEVVDRETLQAFVDGLRVLIPIIEENGPAYLATVQAAIRTEGEDFKYDSIYLIVLNTDGLVIFHGADPSFDGRNMIDLEDVHGVKIVQEILAAAAAGGGFVEYYWDNPAVEGDEDIHSPKLTYAIPITVFGQDYVVAAGIYLDSSTAVEGRSWGQLKSCFNHSLNKREGDYGEL